MRIIQIIPRLTLAGAEIMCENLTNALIDEGHEVFVISLCSVETPITERLRARGVKLFMCDKKSGMDLKIIPKLRKILTDLKPDVIHTHLNSLKYVMWSSRGLKSVKRIHTIHTLANKDGGRFDKFYNKLMFRTGKVVPVALSKEVQASIIELYKIPEESVPVIFNGTDLSLLTGNEMRAVRKDVQIVFQDPYSSLNPRLTIFDILREGLDIHFPEMQQVEKEKLVLQTLADVGLGADVLERYPHAFSGGQRQRIAVARALVLRPKLIVLDEPTSALDVSVQAQLVALLKDLQKRYGLAYLFISHDMRVVKSMADVVYVMKSGKIIEKGKNPDIFKEQREFYTQTLLKAAFNLTAEENYES